MDDRLDIIFKGWAHYFIMQLKNEGINSLIYDYDVIVTNIENQNCQHGENNRLRTQNDFAECCGISYEYYNDISTRSALELIFDKASDLIDEINKAKIFEVDKRLKKLITENSTNDGIDFTQELWWEHFLPKGVIE